METAKCRAAVDLIIEDLKGRSGLEDEWAMIDPEIKQEILETWANIIGNAAEEDWLFCPKCGQDINECRLSRLLVGHPK